MMDMEWEVRVNGEQLSLSGSALEAISKATKKVKDIGLSAEEEARALESMEMNLVEVGK